MKRELDFGLEGTLSPTRASVAHRQIQASSSTCFKRVKGTKVNGYIVYTRVKKSRYNSPDELSENSGNKNFKGIIKPIIGFKESLVDEDPKNKTLIEKSDVKHDVIESRPVNVNVVRDESIVVRDIVEGGLLVEASIEECRIIGENAIVGNLVVEEIGIDDRPVVHSRFCEVSSCKELVISKEKQINGKDTSVVEKGGFEGSSMQIVNSIDGDNNNALKHSKWFFLRPKVEAVDSLECEKQADENVLASNIVGEEAAEGSGSAIPWKNLELKMSKKIAINKCPVTVKELFDTGLLDGVPVVYMGTISSKVVLCFLFFFDFCCLFLLAFKLM